jgi:hypothetical protein
MSGARPDELSIHKAFKYELIIDLKAAKALGVPIGPLARARASRVEPDRVEEGAAWFC